jgi:integrase
MAIRQLHRLTPRQVESIKKDGWHSDGGGLYLRISDQGRRRRWVYRFIRSGKVTEIGLGASDAITLARAREERKRLAETVSEGRNPLDERRRQEREQAGRMNFEQVARAVIDRERKGWSASSLASWEHSLFVHCKSLAEIDVSEIDVPLVKSVVTPLTDANLHPAARRTLSRIKAVLERAIAEGWRRTQNAAEWTTFRHILQKPPRNDDRHHPMVSWEEAPAVIAKLRQSESTSARCVEIIALTALRLTEARAAKWSEFDFDKRVWTIPGNRMKKTKKPFPVPLSDRAVAVIEEIKARRRPGPYVFLGDGKLPISRHAVWIQSRAVTGGKGSPHGFRATFRSWAADHGVEFEVAEACLSHVAGNSVVQAYQRSSMLERRRPVMQAWADFLDGKEAASADDNVVALRTAGRDRSVATGASKETNRSAAIIRTPATLEGQTALRLRSNPLTSSNLNCSAGRVVRANPVR